jgi:hypothetical protein
MRGLASSRVSQSLLDFIVADQLRRRLDTSRAVDDHVTRAVQVLDQTVEPSHGCPGGADSAR